MLYRLLFTAILFLVNSSFVFATTITPREGIFVEVLASEAYATESLAPYFEHTSTDGSTQAYGNLSTGQVGSKAIGSDHYSQTIVTMYDTLTFDTIDAESASISFASTYDGSLASSDRYSHPYAAFGLMIYDITGIDKWLETKNLFGRYDQTQPIDAAQEIYSGYIEFFFDDIGGIHNGSAYNVYDELFGSVTVESDHTYGIRIFSNTSGSEDSYADFLNTGAFEFVDLNGAIYTSGSGVFLDESNGIPTPIPASMTMLLLGIGLLSIVSASRKKFHNFLHTNARNTLNFNI